MIEGLDPFDRCDAAATHVGGDKLADGFHAVRDEFRIQVLEPRPDSAAGHQEGDSRPHRSCSDHGGPSDRIAVGLGTRARKLFGPFAQKEESHQFAGDRPVTQAGVRLADEAELFLIRLADAVAKDVQDLERRGIVPVGRCQDLLGRLPEHEFFEWIGVVDDAADPLEPKWPHAAPLGTHDFPGDVVECLFGNGVMDEPLPRGLPGVERLAREQHGNGFHESDRSRQADRSAPAGHDAELHLRQPKLRLATFVGDAIAAGEGELESTAEAGAGNQSNGWNRRAQPDRRRPAGPVPRTRGLHRPS